MRRLELGIDVYKRQAIGCGEMRGVQEVAKLITGFQERYPLVKFELYSGNNEAIKERMEQGTLDLGLLLEPVSIVKYDFCLLYTSRWGTVPSCSKSFRDE